MNQLKAWAKKQPRKKLIINLCSIFIGIVVGIIFCILSFFSSDVVPAEPEDYLALNEQVAAIQKEPNLIFSTDCELSVKDDTITLILKSAECEITVTLDSSFQILYSKHTDYSMNVFLAVSVSLLGGLFYGVMSGVICSLSLWTVNFFFLWLPQQLKKR